MIIKPLKTEFKSKNVYYTLVDRNDVAAIYSLKYDEDKAIVGYDVIKVGKTTVEKINAFRRL